MPNLNRYLLEPVNTITHAVGAAASIAGLALLLNQTWDDPPKMVSMFIYGLSLIIMFTTSALLHGVKASDAGRMRINRLDHMAIFLLIGGTYTPIAFNTFATPWRWAALVTVWIIVLIGMVYKLLSTKIHGMFNTFIYVFLGWGSALPLVLGTDLFSLMPIPGLLLVLSGGLIYTAGFIIYCFQRPNPWPGRLGHHEIWHLFVLAGSLSHYLFMLAYVVPFERPV
jgi:hemolysin III